MPERGQGADRAATDCKERLTASELDNNGGESGQENASGVREWVLPIWRVTGSGPGMRHAGLQGRARR